MAFLALLNWRAFFMIALITSAVSGSLSAASTAAVSKSARVAKLRPEKKRAGPRPQAEFMLHKMQKTLAKFCSSSAQAAKFDHSKGKIPQHGSNADERFERVRVQPCQASF
jgi:hypothetical protein